MERDGEKNGGRRRGRRKGDEWREEKRWKTRLSVTIVLCILPNDQTRTNARRPFRRRST